MSNHSFDIAIAEEYKSVDLAILVWHFQYWIMQNKRLNRNQHEGRTWTYQTIQEIAAVFPYWSFDQVVRLLLKAVSLKILIKGNFNKSRYDRTAWYAFENEEKFAILRFRKMDIPESQNGNGEIATPIPDTLPNTLTNNNNPVVPSLPKDQKNQSSATASSLADFFLKKIQERNPKFKAPDLKKWACQIDKIIRLDNRSKEDLEAIILWAHTDKFWSINCLSPENLRKNFDKLYMKMQAGKGEEIIRTNREYALSLKEKYPKEMKNLSFDAKYALNRALGKDLPFNLPHESFKKSLVSLFGGSYG